LTPPEDRVQPSDSDGRFGPLATRLLLLVAVVTGTGLLLGALALPGAMAASDVLTAVERDVLDMPPLGEADTPPQNSYVYAADGSELAELNFEENRVPITLDEVPQVAIDAVLATEDAEFYQHQGVNHGAIVRAFVTNLRTGGIEQGGSTITQQYVKNAFLDDSQTYQRKLQEAVYATELEQRLTKPEILERYLNRTYFGRGVYGIGTAAERYFSKDVGDLTLGEAATLAGLIRAPERNNPITSEENAERRRNIVLRQMAHHGFVSPDQARVASEEPLETEISEPAAARNPFWVDWISRLLIEDRVADGLGSQTDALELMGATFEERRHTVFQSGLRVHTTLDPEMQEKAEEALRSHLSAQEASPEDIAREPMGSLVSVDPETGGIMAMAIGPHEYGSCSEDDSWIGEDADGRLLCDRTKLNPAVPVEGSSIGKRQPGSAFKPFLTAAALEEGLPPTLEMDATGPREIENCGGGEDWEVRNIGGDGVLDMYEAMAQSSNVYHALLVDEVGPDKLAQMAQRMGIKPLEDREIYCPLALGTAGVTPLEMASAYATMANRGVHCAPFAITKIENAQGEVIWEHRDDCNRVIDTEVADRLTDILEGPVGSDGTAQVANLGEWPTRGKTGTTNSYTDAWFVGYVKQLATAAWIGYPGGTTQFASLEQAEAVCDPLQDGDGNPVPACEESRYLEDVTVAGQYYSRIFGGTIPAPMWASYMSSVVDRFEPTAFPEPGPLPSGRVPDLLGASSVSEAERLAERAGFRLQTQTVDHWRSSGTFVGQSPGPGDEATLGSRITLEISNGEAEGPAVPDVIGMDLDDAIAVLDEAGYEIGVRDVEVDDDASVDRVVGQSPSPGTSVLPEDDVTVVLDVGVPAAASNEDEDNGDEGDGDDNGGNDDNDDNDEDDEDEPDQRGGSANRGPDGDGPPGRSGD
jgi:penicillin-binding protein 1A